MRRHVASLAVAVSLLLSMSAAALTVMHDREEFGPAAAGVKPAGPEDVFRLSPLRCYAHEHGFDGFGMTQENNGYAFRGSNEDLESALKTFAALSAKDKSLHVLPGPGHVRAKDGRSIRCDWRVSWSKHVARRGPTADSYRATMTVFVTVADAPAKPDPRVRGWVAQLDDDAFAVREAAHRALAALGEAALPDLRAALMPSAPPERRRRLSRLLDALRPISLHRLKVPAGVRAMSLDAVAEEAAREIRSGDPARSWAVTPAVADYAEFSEASWPTLVEMLLDPREQVRGAAGSAFARLGARARAISPTLAAARPKTAESKAAVAAAAKAVGRGPTPPAVEAAWAENRRLRREIAKRFPPAGRS